MASTAALRVHFGSSDDLCLAGTVLQQNPPQALNTTMTPWVPSSVLRSRHAVAHFQGRLHSRHRAAAQPVRKQKDSGGAREAQHTYSAAVGLQVCPHATEQAHHDLAMKDSFGTKPMLANVPRTPDPAQGCMMRSF